MKYSIYTANMRFICIIYRGATGRSEFRISDLACANPYRFKRLRANRGCTIATYNRVLAWFSGHWPEGLKWPADIPRPRASDIAEFPVDERAVADRPAAAPGAASGGESRRA